FAAGDEEAPFGLDDLAGRPEAARLGLDGRPVELERLAVQRRPRRRVGREATHAVVDAPRGLRPVDPGVLTEELGREAGPRVVLRRRAGLAALDAADGLDDGLGAEGGQPVVKLARRLVRADGHAPLEDDLAGIHLRLEEER